MDAPVMCGGVAETSLNDESRQYLTFALAEFNKKSEGVQYKFINDKLEDSVISVQVQVVAGTKHIFTVKLLSSNNNEHKFKFSVWSQPWINFLELIESVEL